MNINPGNMTMSKILKRHYPLGKVTINGERWGLYENTEYGDEVEAIAVNLTARYYTFTYESLEYTATHLDEFELYSMGS